MTAISSKKSILKISDGEISPNFLIIGGVDEMSMRLQRDMIDGSHIASGKWRKPSVDGGLQSLSLQIKGQVSNSIAETRLQNIAMSGESTDYELHQGDGQVLSGNFIITGYERNAVYRKRISYMIKLESVSDVALV